MNEWLLLSYALGGLGVATACALLPGLHVAQVAALMLPLAIGPQPLLPPEGLAFVFVGLASGYAVLSSVPCVYCAIPDEGTALVVLPGQKYLLAGKGPEAVLLFALGSLGGMGCLLLMAPVAPVLLPRLHALLQPHFHWALWCIVAYMLLSEWPKDAGRAPAGLPRLWAAWKGLLAGLVTFLLSGLLGLVLSFRSFLPFSGRPAGLLPAFVGLFGAPGLFQGLAGRRPVPPQRPVERLEIGLKEWLHGTLLGAVGGLFATLFPAVTGGIGAWLAGQGAGQRDGRTFLLSQGASRVGYLLGSLLLLFAPSMHQVKGGIAAPLSTVYANPSPRDGLLALAAATLCTGFAFLLSLELGRWFAHLPVRPLQRASTVLLLFVVAATSGPAGLFVALVAAAIGLLPALWGSRRMNALGVVLLPAALNLSGLSERLAGVLGLL